MATTPTETGLGAVDGERSARLGRLIRAQLGFVWRLLRGLGVTESEADSAAQAVFKAVSQRLGDVRLGNERSFLLSSTLHVAVRARRNRGEQTAISDGAMALEDLDEQRQAREILGALLEQMPLELRVVFVLREIEQLTNTEIADVVGIPILTVESRLNEAQEDFATHLEAESELSLSLLTAARDEQPPVGALRRALRAAGLADIGADNDSEAEAASSPLAGLVHSLRSGSPRGRRSVLQIAAKWLVLGVPAVREPQASCQTGISSSVSVSAAKRAQKL